MKEIAYNETVYLFVGFNQFNRDSCIGLFAIYAVTFQHCYRLRHK